MGGWGVWEMALGMGLLRWGWGCRRGGMGVVGFVMGVRLRRVVLWGRVMRLRRG